MGGSGGGNDGGSSDKDEELGGAGDDASGNKDRWVGGRNLSKRRWDCHLARVRGNSEEMVGVEGGG